MAEGVRRLDVGEVSDGPAGMIELLIREASAHTRLEREDHLPGWFLLKPCQQLRCLLAETLYHAGVIGRSFPFPRHPHCCLGTFQAMEGDGVLRQCHDAHGKCDGLSLDQARNSSTIPALEDLSEGTLDAYLRTVRHLIRWVTQLPESFGQFQPHQLTRTTVEQYLTYLEQEGLGLPHRTRVKSTISNFALFLIEEKGLLKRNPTRSIELPPVPLSKSDHLSGAQRSILRSLV